MMKWASAVSRQIDVDLAVADASAAVRASLGGDADLAIVFASSHHAIGYERIPEAASAALGVSALVGCSAGGVIGAGREVEDEPGLSITAARLPGVEIATFHVDGSSSDDPALSPSASPADFLLLADPFGFDTEPFLQALDAEFPESRKVGGLASGGGSAGENALFHGKHTRRSGLVGVRCGRGLRIDTLVAQGCRPIGEVMFVTRARGNVILGLDGRWPIDTLRDLYESLDPSDRELFRHSLFIGLVMRESREAYRQGDFLVRNLIGMDPEQGALFIGALVREGAVVQFHLRDAQTSAHDLREALEGLDGETRGGVRGSVLFSCLGRGRHLYGRRDHDTELFRRYLGDVPLGGFFCNGEIGPVQGMTFLHGYTSSFALFRER
jgi:small ligand-binding sensory domain FIST